MKLEDLKHSGIFLTNDNIINALIEEKIDMYASLQRVVYTMQGIVHKQNQKIVKLEKYMEDMAIYLDNAPTSEYNK